MKDRKLSVQTVGASSLLTILAVLALATFALLSMATVQSQRGLAQASAESVSLYYAADAAAEQWLFELRQEGTPGYYESSFPLGDRQTLEAAVEIQNKDTYAILRWQTVTVSRDPAENTLVVWDGE